jgi:hypothetical protein
LRSPTYLQACRAAIYPPACHRLNYDLLTKRQLSGSGL